MNRQERQISISNRQQVLQTFSLEPLPSSVERELCEIDELVARHASRLIVPAGLAERIFQASVDRLIGSPRSMPLDPVARWQWRAAGLSRLALAAAMALAFVFAAQFIQSPSAPPINVAMGDQISSDVEWFLLDRPENWSANGSDLGDFNGSPNTEAGSILEIRDISFDDLSRDVSKLLSTSKASS